MHLQALNRGAAGIEEQLRMIVGLRRKRRVHDTERLQRTLRPRHDLILRVQPVAIGVLPEGMMLILLQVRLKLIGARLGPRLKLRGTESQALATPGGDGDHAGRCARAVQRGRRCTFDHLDRLHIHRFDVLRGDRLGLIQEHTVHHEERRRGRAAFGDAGNRGAEHDVDAASRLAAGAGDGHTGHFTRNQIGGRAGGHDRNVFRRDLVDRNRGLGYRLRVHGTRHRHLIEARGRHTEGDVHRDQAVGHQPYVVDPLRTVAEPPRINVIKSRRGAGDDEATVWPRARRDGRTDEEDVDAGERYLGRDIGHQSDNPCASRRLRGLGGRLR